MENLAQEIENIINNSRKQNISEKINEEQINIIIEKINNQINSVSEELKFIKDDFSRIKNSEKTNENLLIDKQELLLLVFKDIVEHLETLTGFYQIMTNFSSSIREKELKEIALRMDFSTKDLLLKIQNVTMWLSIQSKGIECDFQIINLKETFEDIICFFQSALQKKNITLKLNISGIFFVKHDSKILNYLIKNIISNAIRYSYYGSEIIIKTRQFNQSVELIIQDKGIGMTKEEVNSLFNNSLKNSFSGTYKEKGYGLGLLSFEELIKKTNGIISITSEKNEGTRIGFTMPIAKEKMKEHKTKNELSEIKNF